MDIYRKSLGNSKKSSLPLEIVETDIDLYYKMALSMYINIEKNSKNKKPTIFILPVGPVFQYRRFIEILKMRPLDLSQLYCFFMDEYLGENGILVDIDNPLSFRGFIERELIHPMPKSMHLNEDHIFFPDPHHLGDYDSTIETLGFASICFAGVGINGHIAFNEPPIMNKSTEDFLQINSHVQELTKETITINSNTAMRGAYEKIPRRAVTIGMRQIFNSKRIEVYLNRPWQSAVLRKMLFGEISPEFPASLLRLHKNVAITATDTVAEPPEFALK